MPQGAVVDERGSGGVPYASERMNGPHASFNVARSGGLPSSAAPGTTASFQSSWQAQMDALANRLPAEENVEHAAPAGKDAMKAPVRSVQSKPALPDQRGIATGGALGRNVASTREPAPGSRTRAAGSGLTHGTRNAGEVKDSVRIVAGQGTNKRSATKNLAEDMLDWNAAPATTLDAVAATAAGPVREIPATTLKASENSAGEQSKARGPLEKIAGRSEPAAFGEGHLLSAAQGSGGKVTMPAAASEVHAAEAKGQVQPSHDAVTENRSKEEEPNRTKGEASLNGSETGAGGAGEGRAGPDSTGANPSDDRRSGGTSGVADTTRMPGRAAKTMELPTRDPAEALDTGAAPRSGSFASAQVSAQTSLRNTMEPGAPAAVAAVAPAVVDDRAALFSSATSGTTRRMNKMHDTLAAPKVDGRAAVVDVAVGAAPVAPTSTLANQSTGASKETAHGADGGTILAAMDAPLESSGAQWTHVGMREAEAGFNDPSLGWIGVRAERKGSTVVATLVPDSARASQELESHMAGLSTYLSAQHSNVGQLGVAVPESRESTSTGSHGFSFGGQDGGHAQQQPGQDAERDAHTASGPGIDPTGERTVEPASDRSFEPEPGSARAAPVGRSDAQDAALDGMRLERGGFEHISVVA